MESVPLEAVALCATETKFHDRSSRSTGLLVLRASLLIKRSPVAMLFQGQRQPYLSVLERSGLLSCLRMLVDEHGQGGGFHSKRCVVYD